MPAKQMTADPETQAPLHTIVTAPRVLSADDIATYSALSGDRSPIHCDAEFAKRSHFGGIIAHGTLVLAVAQGLMVSSGIFRDSIAFLGLTWRMKGPVRPGDTLHVEFAVNSRRPSRTDPRHEIVELSFRVINQFTATVGEGSWTQLFPVQQIAGRETTKP
jgi:acyl dehydratase